MWEIMKKHICKAVTMAMLLFSVTFAYSQELELIWLETDRTDSTIYYSQHKNNRWSPKQRLTTDNEIKLTPAIASNADKHIAVWVTFEESGKLSLSYSIKQGGQWRPPQPVEFNFHEITAPAIINYSHKFYLFFAGNNRDDDDIYMSTFDNNSWSDPVIIHPDNSVPDLLPEPRIINGTLVLIWQQFDGDRYVNQKQEIVPLNKSRSKMARQRLNIKRQSPEKAPQIDLRPKHKNILKTKFNTNLPPDFKGVGLINAYANNEQEMPTFYILSESD